MPRQGHGMTGTHTPGPAGPASRPGRDRTLLLRLLGWAARDSRPRTPAEKTRRREEQMLPNRAAKGSRLEAKRRKDHVIREHEAST